MLFHVKMTVNLPFDMNPDLAAQLKADEMTLAQRLQQQGKWRHHQRLGAQGDRLATRYRENCWFRAIRWAASEGITRDLAARNIRLFGE